MVFPKLRESAGRGRKVLMAMGNLLPRPTVSRSIGKNAIISLNVALRVGHVLDPWVLHARTTAAGGGLVPCGTSTDYWG